jgi:hypothetical protein
MTRPGSRAKLALARSIWSEDSCAQRAICTARRACWPDKVLAFRSSAMHRPNARKPAGRPAADGPPAQAGRVDGSGAGDAAADAAAAPSARQGLGVEDAQASGGGGGRMSADRKRMEGLVARVLLWWSRLRSPGASGGDRRAPGSAGGAAWLPSRRRCPPRAATPRRSLAPAGGHPDGGQAQANRAVPDQPM